MEAGAWFEHRFWLQILGDHARFIYNALSPEETGDIELAKQFLDHFDRLLEKARAQGDANRLSELNKEAHEAAEHLRSFKLHLLDRRLLGQAAIGLTPTFLNHMVNELEEYLTILNELLSGKPVPHFTSLHHDLLWLPDAAGHAAAIAMDLDAVEQRLIQKSEAFEKHFNDFYLKAIELAGYLRTLRPHYPALTKFHSDVNAEMAVFMAFLKEVEELGLSAELLSRLSPLVPDHMFREECYYLLKLSECGAVPPPDCNPARPRLE
ncbi:DUF2935 domain-containing protein [Paenibacillus arenilitoris]|uniref:DUF2935 domain-containing protein n=1 Tax=Paenibacillus arenilitoris TaxID=2772299 RepID=A0A927CV32_9BACL|nr:DUF2935 domain-containing protein [Paenibacillus arenilitoris]MBD2872095.1 DUF2935 domain-containing protein [Paenibacillus arenilitoris]